MDTKGTPNATWGFSAPDPGWYLFRFLEGIVVEDTGAEKKRKTLRLPLTIEEGDFAGTPQSIFVTLDGDTDKAIAFNKKKIADILENTGLYADFEKKYPGDVDILSDAVVKGLMVKLPGRLIMGKLEEVKGKKQPDGSRETYINLNQIASQSFKPPVGSAKGKEKDKKAAAAGDDSAVNW